MTKEELIKHAYNKAKKTEITLLKQEIKFRKMTDAITITRQELVKYKDEIAQLHREISAPLLPVFDPKPILL